MKRTILKAPAAFTFADLTAPQIEAISAIHGQWVAPMPGTMAVAGLHLIDAVMTDQFDPDNIAALGLPFEVMAIWQWDGSSHAMTALQALDTQAFAAFLAPVEGMPPQPYEPHRWAGWPAAF